MKKYAFALFTTLSLFALAAPQASVAPDATLAATTDLPGEASTGCVSICSATDAEYSTAAQCRAACPTACYRECF